MIVLHVLWDDVADGRLYFWLERTPRPHQRIDQQIRHPGAYSHAALNRAVGLWISESLAARATTSRRTLLLPTVGGVPLPSPELRDPTVVLPDSKHIVWQPWVVPVLTLPDASAALARLSKAIARDKLPPDVKPGAPAQFWLAANALVDELIARRSFAPYAGDDDHTLLARWSPVFDGAASARLRELAAAMPGACRAIIPRGIDPAAHRPPDATPLLLNFIERILDRRARKQLRPALREHIPFGDATPAARWLRRLVGKTSNAYLVLRTIADHDFGEAVRVWLAPFHVLPQARGRLCVQLDEPAYDRDNDISNNNDDSEAREKQWKLSYFIQDLDEPSVLVPVRQNLAPRQPGCRHRPAPLHQRPSHPAHAARARRTGLPAHRREPAPAHPRRRNTEHRASTRLLPRTCCRAGSHRHRGASARVVETTAYPHHRSKDE